MVPTRDTLQIQEHKQTEHEEMGKDIPCEWKPKESKDSYAYIRKNRLYTKICNKR